MTAQAKRCFPGVLFLVLLGSSLLFARQQKVVWSEQEKPVQDAIRSLRSLPTEERARTTKDLALRIRELPPGRNKVVLALGLASRATEGDFGRDTLQEVATTLADAVRESPFPAEKNGPAAPYVELAELMRYEHVEVTLNDPQMTAAVAKVHADDASRQKVDFTLQDLQGRQWTLRELRGKVVLVNFWATWCPPCRSEMPDLEALYQRFANQGLVVLAISDEESEKVRPFIDQYKFSFPVLLDRGHAVSDQFHVEGIPKSFVYDRDGRLVAQSIDMRTKRQFLEMLSRAGLQ
jgi:peroxiredoxin